MSNQNTNQTEGLMMTELQPVSGKWKTVSLGDIVQVYDSQRIPLRADDRKIKKGIYPYCGANGIIDHINEYIFDGEFLLLAEDGGYWHQFDESSYVMDGKFWVNNHAHILAAIAGIANNRYLMYYLNYSDISVFIGGTTRGKLTQGVMRSIPVSLPPISEQKLIARLLSTIQKAIESQDKIIVAVGELKKSLMQHLFTYGPVPPAEADKVQLKETEIGLVPEQWDLVKLGDVITKEIKNGAFVRRDNFGNGIRFLNVADTYNNINVDFMSSERVQVTNEEINAFSIAPGDLFYVRSSLKREGIGQCCIVESLSETTIYDCHLMRVKVDDKKVLPKYLAYFSVSY